MRGPKDTTTTCASGFESERPSRDSMKAVSSPVESTHEPLKILDLGCGTGLEIEALLRRVPNAQVTGIDVSEKMLQLLRRRYAANVRQISLVADSYLDDIVPRPDVRLRRLGHVHPPSAPRCQARAYRKIRAALKSGGKYAEGDTVTRSDAERQFLDDYAAEVGRRPAGGGKGNTTSTFPSRSRRSGSCCLRQVFGTSRLSGRRIARRSGTWLSTS